METEDLLREFLDLKLTWIAGLGRLCHGGMTTTHGCPECGCHGSGAEHHRDDGKCRLERLKLRVLQALGEPAGEG